MKLFIGAIIFLCTLTACGKTRDSTFCQESAQQGALFCADFDDDGTSIADGWNDTSKYTGQDLTFDTTLAASRSARVAAPGSATDCLANHVTLSGSSATIDFDLNIQTVPTDTVALMTITISRDGETDQNLELDASTGQFAMGVAGTQVQYENSLAEHKWVHIEIQLTAESSSASPEGNLGASTAFVILVDGTQVTKSVAPIPLNGPFSSLGGDFSAITLGIGACDGPGAANFAIDNVVLMSP